MIFVTVGMHGKSFDRLVAAMDRYAARTLEPVVIQTGCAEFIPRHARWFRFASPEDMDRYTSQARLIVSHGSSALLSAVGADKSVIAVPRRRCFAEHDDDSQVDFVNRLAARGLVIGVIDIDDLDSTIDQLGVHATSSRHHALVSYDGGFAKVLA